MLIMSCLSVEEAQGIIDSWKRIKFTFHSLGYFDLSSCLFSKFITTTVNLCAFIEMDTLYNLDVERLIGQNIYSNEGKH